MTRIIKSTKGLQEWCRNENCSIFWRLSRKTVIHRVGCASHPHCTGYDIMTLKKLSFLLRFRTKKPRKINGQCILYPWDQSSWRSLSNEQEIAKSFLLERNTLGMYGCMKLDQPLAFQHFILPEVYRGFSARYRHGINAVTKIGIYLPTQLCTLFVLNFTLLNLHSQRDTGAWTLSKWNT